MRDCHTTIAAIQTKYGAGGINAAAFAQRVAMLSLTATAFTEGLLAACIRFEINTPLRQAHFFAQLMHESNGFKSVAENLSYTAERLAVVWPRRFAQPSDSGKSRGPNDLARSVERKPEALANIVYANRLGNGDVASGDGWQFAGKGLLQITGRENYRACSLALFGDQRLLDNPQSLLLPDAASLSAGWFWGSHGLNRLADRDDVDAITRAINGGVTGIEDRKARLIATKRIFIGQGATA